MVYQKITKEEMRIVEKLQFFDSNGYFPFEKKRINFSLSGEAIQKLSNIKNKSKYIEKLILA